MKREADIKKIIRDYRKNMFEKRHVALFEFLFREGPKLNLAKLKRTYEGNKCD